MEKSNYDFVPIKQKILLEARRLVETYHIDTRHRCIRASIPVNSGNGDTAASVSTVQWKKNSSRIF